MPGGAAKSREARARVENAHSDVVEKDASPEDRRLTGRFSGRDLKRIARRKVGRLAKIPGQSGPHSFGVTSSVFPQSVGSLNPYFQVRLL